VRAFLGAVLVALAAAPSRARADDPTPIFDAQILPAPASGLRIESVSTRVTAYDQFGHGYQSQAGPLLGPGSERTTVFEPQVEIVATQGARLTHRIWVPIDVVSAASPDAIDNSKASADVVSSASRKVRTGTVDWTTTYRAAPVTDVSIRSALHIEEPFRSWANGLALTHSFAEESTIVSASLLDVFDWFDRFDVTGHRFGQTSRVGTTGTLGLTRVLTPTTLANVNYGLTVQNGTMGNTWNSVPIAPAARGSELLPGERVRSALVGRASQFLPWNGALRAYYRFYADDWGIVAHSIEGMLMQRLTPVLYVGGLYRFHTQTGARFFTTLASPGASLRVADSDLAPLDSQTIGGKIVTDFPLVGDVRALHLELGYERYVRTNDLQINVVTWATGFRF
jgi:hypothetical protein